MERGLAGTLVYICRPSKQASTKLSGKFLSTHAVSTEYVLGSLHGYRMCPVRRPVYGAHRQIGQVL